MSKRTITLPAVVGKRIADRVAFDLGKRRGIVEVTHHGSFLEINSALGRLVIRPNVSNVIYVTTELLK